MIACAAFALAACNTTGELANQAANPPASDNPSADNPSPDIAANALAAVPYEAGPPPLGLPAAAEPGLLGSDPNDDLSLGKKQYRAANFGLAEKYFRHAVELHPRDAEAWLGLAASYDRLRRFDLADRAYAQAIGIVGETVEILNNQGFSYMLRGDFKRARSKLAAAQRRAPGNKFVANNLHLLNESIAQGKQVE
jgi:tetratricopeptide (TPR) repeat protein